MQININGRLHTGTETEIVEQMKSFAFGGDDETISQYVDRVARTMLGDPGASFGSTDAEKCNSLLRNMLKKGLATICIKTKDRS